MSAAARTRLVHKLILAAHRVQKRADRQVAAETDLSTAQAAVLSILKEQGNATQRAVATALGLNNSALTAMTGRLLRLGYVVRERDATDGRAWRLALSAAGAEALDAARPPFTRVNQRIEEALSEADILVVANALDRLSEAFAEDDEP